MPRSNALPKILRLAAAALALPLVGGCGNDGSGETRVAVIGPMPAVRDPGEAMLAAGDEVLLQSVGQGLVAFDPSGNIVAGLAERWNVSDNGLSYIFRLAPTKWSDGRKLTAEQVARALRRAIAQNRPNPLRDTLGAIESVKAMTDRVIEIELTAPRPNLLALLAQPQFAILRGKSGTGPFTLAPKPSEEGWLTLTREVGAGEDEEPSEERVLLTGMAAEQALAGFAAGKVDLVLGGTFADLPLAQRTNVARSALRFDPAAGLFGLIPARSSGPLAKPELRALLSRAIDREALIAAFAVNGLTPRATILEPALDGGIGTQAPAWTAIPIDQRRAAAAAAALDFTSAETKTKIRVLLPAGPGGDLLLHRLELDWGSLGFAVERTNKAAAADLMLVDSVAPSASPAWYVRRMRCGVAAICDPRIDELLDGARAAQVAAQRYALIAQAAAVAEEQTLFIPLAAPIRWSMVDNGVLGFAVNRFARHSLAGLRLDRRARKD